MTRRLLIVAASVGSGHVRAAQALEETARALHPRLEVTRVDVLDFVGGAYRAAYAKSYDVMIESAPALWGRLYEATHDQSAAKPNALVRSFDRLEFRKFRAFVRDLAPDALLSTHFLPAQIFAPPRARGRDRFRFGLVLTDFDVHGFWVQPTCDVSFVASEELKAILVSRGVSPVDVTGIPIVPGFASPLSRGEARRRLAIGGGERVVLVMSGGAGVRALREAVDAALCCDGVRVLAVAGKNAELQQELQALSPPAGRRLDVLGFVDNVHELMAAADVAVTKSGGLTTSECLASGLPMVVRDPIPGQEERNAEFVLEAGAGVKALGPVSLRYKLETLLADPARLSRMSRAAKAAGRPRAAQEIVERILTGP